MNLSSVSPGKAFSAHEKYSLVEKQLSVPESKCSQDSAREISSEVARAVSECSEEGDFGKLMIKLLSEKKMCVVSIGKRRVLW